MAAVRLVREAVDVHPLGGAGHAVVDEHVRGRVVDTVHVLGPVGVSGHEVGGGRAEGHEAAVGAERGPAATPVPLVAGAVDAYPLSRAGLAVVDEHVPLTVGVSGHEVGGGRDEGYEAAVGAECQAGGGGTDSADRR